MVGYDRCDFCGWAPLPEQTDPATGVVVNQNPDTPGFAGFNLTAVAELCAGPSLYAEELASENAFRVTHTTSSIVSWCKSGGDNALGRLVPGTFLAGDCADRRRSVRPPD
jgi:hypothetical protein